MSSINLNELTTFDLAFNLATGKYDEKDKFEALSIIKSREQSSSLSASQQPVATELNKAKKPPLAGSKAEKILKMVNDGKSAKQIYESLNKTKGVTVYYPEIYRVIKTYKPTK